MKASPTIILIRIDKLRDHHTTLCKAGRWEEAQRINDSIIREWKKYHSAVASSKLLPQPQIGSVPFTKYFEMLRYFLVPKGKQISETDARALYAQGKSVLDVIENMQELL